MRNIRQWEAGVLNGGTRKAVPIMTYPGIELCGHTVREAVTDGRVHADAILRLNDTYPADAVTAIMDLTVEAEAFGAAILFRDDEIPCVEGRLLCDRDDVLLLQIPSLGAGRVPEYLKANRLVAGQITGKPVFAGCIGPFSLAARLYGMTELMMAMFTESDIVHVLLEKCTCFLADYCRAMKEAGASGVIMAEPVAGLISNEDCSTFSSAYVRRICDAVQDDSFLVVLHNCGNGGHCTPAMCQSGARALHFGNRIDMVEALDSVPRDVLAMGNLDPVGLFMQADADTVYAETMNMLERTKDYPNFVLSTGCDIPPHIPHQNIEAFYRAVRAFNNA